MNLILLIVSILIYASYGIKNLIYILSAIIISFTAAKFLNKENKYRKIILIITISLNVANLIFARIQNYTNINIIGAIGISYYTLQIISYLVDVYKGKYQAETKLHYYALYIMYIPHLFIGPITRYDEMKKQLETKRKIRLCDIQDGVIRILWGIFKKLIIAGRISLIIETIVSNTSLYQGTYALFAMLLYSIQLYSDFSGGIDIVLGISKILGINLSENFDAPFLAQNIKDFWRRWHISLSTWLKDYIYIPLGGNRHGKTRQALNVLITFLISGLWHGISYILWGLIHGIFVILGDRYKTKSKIFNRTLNFLIVSILWSFFIWENSTMAIRMTTSIFTNWNITELAQNILHLGLTSADWILLAISTIILFIFEENKSSIIEKTQKLSNHKKLIIICIMILVILTFGIYGIGFNASEFIYSKF